MKLSAVILSIIIAASIVLFGCAHGAEGEAESQDTIPSKDVLEYYQNIMSFPRSGPSYPADINGYLMEQAGMLGIDAEKDELGNVIMRIPATAGRENSRPVALLSYTGADIVSDQSRVFDPYSDGVWLLPSDDTVRAEGTSMGAGGALGAATILAALENAESHGAITAVFAAGNGAVNVDGDTVSHADAHTGEIAGGAGEWIPAFERFGFPEDSVLIGIGGADTGGIITEAPMATLLEASTTASAVEAGSGRAYVIGASGFPSGAAVAGDDDHMNPIAVIAGILSEAKNSGLAFGLCGFTGGSDACSTPSEAQAIVILRDYEERRFRTVFKSIAEKSLDELDDAGDIADIRMVETKRPAVVVDEESASKALSYLYGLMSIGGSGAKEPSAKINIGKVELTPSAFTCGIAVTGYDADGVEQKVNEQFAIERLSGIPVKMLGDLPGFGGMKPDAEQAPDDAAALRDKACADVTGDRVSADALGAVSPLGSRSDLATVRSIGISVRGEGTPYESFSKKDAAVPANIIKRYLELS
jgi:di/tripeptidase